MSASEDARRDRGGSPRGQKCKVMGGPLEEGASLIDEDIDPEVLDAGIIAAAQRVEHYEIAAYGSACEFARTLKHDDVVAPLDATLQEEVRRRRATQLARRTGGRTPCAGGARGQRGVARCPTLGSGFTPGQSSSLIFVLRTFASAELWLDFDGTLRYARTSCPASARTCAVGR